MNLKAIKEAFYIKYNAINIEVQKLDIILFNFSMVISQETITVNDNELRFCVGGLQYDGSYTWSLSCNQMSEIIEENECVNYAYFNSANYTWEINFKEEKEINLIY